MERNSLRMAFGVLSFFLFLLWATGGLSLWAAEKVRVGAAPRGVPVSDLPLLAAEEKGMWKQNAINAEWIPFQSAGDMYRAMVAGSVDVALGVETVSVLQAIARGVKASIVADMGARDYFQVWVKGDGPIKKASDLKGANIGIPSIGGAGYAFSLVIFRGLGLEKDVRLVSVGSPAARVAALKTGAIDAFILTVNPVAALAATGEIRSVASAKEFIPEKLISLNSNMMAARKDYLDKNPDMVGKALKSIFQATDFIMKDRAWVLAKLKSGWGYEKEVAEVLVPILQYSKDGRIDPEGLRNVIKFLVEYQILKKEEAPPNLEEIYTTRFTR